MDEINLTLKLHHPLTEEEWDTLTDADLETDYIEFHTKHGKTVKFAKLKEARWEPVFTDYVLPTRYICSNCSGTAKPTAHFCPWCGAKMEV